jgi:predicted SprT family Zn-dependent metalloprotease
MPPRCRQPSTLAATAIQSHIANMAEPNLSNWECKNCGAKLLLKRRSEPKRRREEALCPNCMINLPPRDGKDTLQYTLVELPKTSKPA